MVVFVEFLPGSILDIILAVPVWGSQDHLSVGRLLIVFQCLSGNRPHNGGKLAPFHLNILQWLRNGKRKAVTLGRGGNDPDQ